MTPTITEINNKTRAMPRKPSYCWTKAQECHPNPRTWPRSTRQRKWQIAKRMETSPIPQLPCRMFRSWSQKSPSEKVTNCLPNITNSTSTMLNDRSMACKLPGFSRVLVWPKCRRLMHMTYELCRSQSGRRLSRRIGNRSGLRSRKMTKTLLRWCMQ